MVAHLSIPKMHNPVF
uniref:Uncharacterized protein n=1 Tax=Anguilla anguilla TaxID=7936 RepID=A0A0E9PWN4_ANGAN